MERETSSLEELPASIEGAIAASEDRSIGLPSVVTPVATPIATTTASGGNDKSKRKSRASGTATEAEAPLDPALGGTLEAIIISLDRPVQPLRLAQGLGLLPESEGESDVVPVEGPVAKAAVRLVERVIANLNDQYEQSHRSFRIESVAGGYRVMTLAGFAAILATFHKRQASSKLSRAGVETLAIIAYKQPLTKAELEAIRGVSCGEVLKTLLERRLVTVKGRAEELGRPLLYGTTTDFLKLFGLASIKDLPSPTELRLTT